MKKRDKGRDFLKKVSVAFYVIVMVLSITQTAAIGIWQSQRMGWRQGWSINAVSTRIPVRKIDEIAARPDVKKVWLDKEVRLIEPVMMERAGMVEDYGDAQINAPYLLDLGYDGTDILCMSLGDWQEDGRGRDLLSIAVTNAVEVWGCYCCSSVGE